MFMSRHGRAAAHHPSARHSTLLRRYDFHLGEAFLAALQGSHDKAAGHSSRALLISRELVAGAADPARHQPELAAALCAHARYGVSGGQAGAAHAIALLTESAGHYAALAAADPAVYEVPRIDVLTGIALAFEEAGDSAAAVSLLREVTALYLKAPAADPEERDLALARARFQLGRCLIAAGAEADGLAETETGLELAASVLSRLQLPAAGPGGQADQRGWAVSGKGADPGQRSDPGWLARAPRFLQLAAPDWVAAAARAMTLHRAAGRWTRAAAAAGTAVAVSGGLAGLGGDTLRETHAAITARADEVLAQAALTSQPQTTARPAAPAAPSGPAGPAAPDHGPRKKQGKAKHPERSAAD
jgi:tetratricopeptide (TPR) repeat protein